MSRVARICSRCQRIRPCACTDREAIRRRHRNHILGRGNAHWQRLSRWARDLQPWCSRCGSSHDLTVDLVGGGDHRVARLEDVRVLCRSCHGRQDGGKRGAFLSNGPLPNPSLGLFKKPRVSR